MLRVKTKVGPSIIHGMGLFADEFIPKGTCIWQFDHGFDIDVLITLLDQFPKDLKKWLYTYGWKHEDHYYLPLDDARYVNHAGTGANTTTEDDPFSPVFAIKDISQGDEITCDYFKFNEITREYGIE